MLDGLFPMQTPLEVELTVIGLFHINVEQIVSEHTVEDAIAENHIFVDNTTAEEYAACGGDPLNYLWAIFYVEDPADYVEDPAELDTVMQRARARDDINWEYFTLSVDESSYQSALEPLQSISTAFVDCGCSGGTGHGNPAVFGAADVAARTHPGNKAVLGTWNRQKTDLGAVCVGMHVDCGIGICAGSGGVCGERGRSGEYAAGSEYRK